MRLANGFAAVLAMLLCVLPSFAQNDSAAFASGPWTETRVCRGITLKQCHFENGSLFAANEYVSVLIVSRWRRADIVTSPEGALALTSELAGQTGAIAAVNGSYFNMKAPYGPTTYVRVDGEQTGRNLFADADDNRKVREGGSLAFRRSRAGVYKVVSEDLEWEDNIRAEDVLSSGPMLLVGGECDSIANVKFNTRRHPRTAAGVRKDGSKVFVVVDGRTKQSEGVSIPELQRIMLWLGCTDAVNLDGGGSTTMVVRGEIVNHPCDNHKFDAAGERSVANAVVIGAPKSKRK